MANVAPVRKSAVVATDPVDADEARTVSSEFGKAPGAEADPLLSFESERKVAETPKAPANRHSARLIAFGIAIALAISAPLFLYVRALRASSNAGVPANGTVEINSRPDGAQVVVDRTAE